MTGLTDADDLWWRRAYREQAKRMDTAGNIASGHAMYGLANRCWQLASKLRESARSGDRLDHEHDRDSPD